MRSVESIFGARVNDGLVLPLPTQRYAVILADPAWNYLGQRQHAGPGKKDTGGAITHYPTVTVSQMKTWDIPSICEKDCLLFMWSSSPHLDQAIDLGKSWGFSWATVAFVWYKQRTNPGFYTMSECELCLVMKKGRIPRPRGSRNQRQFLSELRGEHSVKPDEVRERIARMFPTQKKLEMFATKRVAGWDSWGLSLT
jgi:N6-adenosine-specific RNA methylase IME4